MIAARECFELAVRIVGVGTLVFGLLDLVNSFLFYYNYFSFPDSTSGYYLIAGWSCIFIGLYLIRGASHLINFAYPYKDGDKDIVEDEKIDGQNPEE